MTERRSQMSGLHGWIIYFTREQQAEADALKSESYSELDGFNEVFFFQSYSGGNCPSVERAQNNKCKGESEKTLGKVR